MYFEMNRNKKNNMSAKNIAIARLFDERDNLKIELERQKNINRKFIEKFQYKMNEFKCSLKQLKDKQEQDYKEFVSELMSLYSCEICVCNTGDEKCFHKVNLLTYLNTPD